MNINVSISISTQGTVLKRKLATINLLHVIYFYMENNPIPIKGIYFDYIYLFIRTIIHKQIPFFLNLHILYILYKLIKTVDYCK